MRKISFALAMAMLLVACGGSYQKSLTTSANALQASWSGFEKWDEYHQNEIIAKCKPELGDPEFQRCADALSAYYMKRSVVMEVYSLAWNSIAIAALEPKAENLLEAARRIKVLYEAIKSLKEGS